MFSCQSRTRRLDSRRCRLKACSTQDRIMIMRGAIARLLTAGTLLVPCVRAQQPPDFVRDVQPVLESRCWSCHGAQLQVHGLRLDRRADALKGGGSGVPAIVPGKSAQSLLIKYVSGLDKDGVMPPAGGRLKPAEVELLR